MPPDVGNLSYTDNKADVYARKSSNLVLSADLNRDGYQDWIYRTTSGAVYWDHVVLNSARDDGSWASTKIFTNWKTRKQRHLQLAFARRRRLEPVQRAGRQGSEIFGTPKPLGTGFQQYGIFG